MSEPSHSPPGASTSPQAGHPDRPSPPAGARPEAPLGLGRLRIERKGTAGGARRRARWPWAVGLASLAGLLAWWWTPRVQEIQVSSVVSVTPSQQYTVLTASGYVVAQRRAAVATKATGRLVELTVREGAQVKKGEVLARLDASDVRAASETAGFAVAQAQAGVRQAQSQEALARVELGTAQSDQVRLTALRAQGFISEQALEVAQRRLDAARANVKVAGDSVTAAMAAVATAQAQARAQAVNEDYTVIRAPFDGVVLEKKANVGDIITPFSSAAGSQGAVVTMADLSTLEVEADVSESNLAKVTRGAPVEITLDALPDVRLRGEVASIVPTVDRAKATVMTKIRFAAIDPRVLPEMSAKVSFLSQAPTAAELKPVLAVNPKAVLTREGQSVVLRLAPETSATEAGAGAGVKPAMLEAVPVTLGRRIGELQEISLARPEGLRSGDRVALTPLDRVKAGDRVRVAAK